MNNYRHFGAVATLALACAIFAAPAGAQSTTDHPVETRPLQTPTVVKVTTPKAGWLKAEVIHFDSNSITVREADNERMVHTFTYAASAQSQVQKILDKGGYQYGDKVRIRYQAGQTIALAIHGRPSKPL